MGNKDLLYTVVCAVLATFNVPSSRFNLTAAAIAFLVASMLFGGARI